MRLSIICLIWDVIWFQLKPIGFSDRVPLRLGKMPRWFNKEFIEFLWRREVNLPIPGILNAGSDFDHTTTPYDVGLGDFVDQDKGNFIGKTALAGTSHDARLTGILCQAKPHIGAEIRINGQVVGRVTAGAISPYLKQGIGIALMNESGYTPDTEVMIGCIDGKFHGGSLAELPLYDKQCEIPRGKLADIPERD